MSQWAAGGGTRAVSGYEQRTGGCWGCWGLLGPVEAVWSGLSGPAEELRHDVRRLVLCSVPCAATF